jgi:dihydropteroate synthase
LAIDPGLGFAKVAAHDWALLAHLDMFTALGLPVLVGSSRKSFLGRLLADTEGKPRTADLREDATTALTMYAAMNGAWGVRVHRVRSSVDAALVAAAVRAAR